MSGIDGKKKIVAIVAASVFTVGAVAAAVMTGVIPYKSSEATPEAATATAPAPSAATAGVHKRTDGKARTGATRVASEETTPPPPPPCTNCGVIESIESFTEKGKASGGGAVAGGLLGGILGHQIGKGHGKDLATVAGAVGGAIAGNEIEKNANKVMRYHVGVRMEDGTRELLTLTAAPSVAVGDRVKIVNGELVKD